MTPLTAPQFQSTLNGTIERIRDSDSKGLLTEKQALVALRRTDKLRNETVSLSSLTTAQTDELRSLVTLYGAANLSSVLGLLGSGVSESHHEMVHMLDRCFYPVSYCWGGETQLSCITSTPLDGEMPDRVREMYDKSESYRFFGSRLSVCDKHRELSVFGYFTAETASHAVDKYPTMTERRDEVVAELSAVIDRAFVEGFIDNMSIREFVESTSLVGAVTDARELMKRMCGWSVAEYLEWFQKADTYNRQHSLVLSCMMDTLVDAIPETSKVVGKEYYNVLVSSLGVSAREKIPEIPESSTAPEDRRSGIGMVIIDLSCIQESMGRVQEDEPRTARPLACASGDKSVGAGKGKRKRQKPPTLREQVESCGAPAKAIEKALLKVRTIEKGHAEVKAEEFVEGFLKIPWGKLQKEPILTQKPDLIDAARQLQKRVVKKLPVLQSMTIESLADVSTLIGMVRSQDIDSYKPYRKRVDRLEMKLNQMTVDRREYIGDVRATLDSAVHGHKEAKDSIERLIAQWMSGKSTGSVIGLQGPPGNGKTSLIRNGLSNCLRDADGRPRPTVFVPLGGVSNSSSLIGHGYTYQGSTWGRIAGGLMEAGCMNPIIFFDELDKVSGTERGRAVLSVLTHLTDPTQNTEFHDQYFQGVPFDVSKATFVFTFNDPSRIDPILRDRIMIIKTNPLKIPEKLVIGQRYLLPTILRDVGIRPDEFSIEDQEILNLIEDYTYEAGVRRLKELLTMVARECNRRWITGKMSRPFKLDRAVILDMIQRKTAITHERIKGSPQVGVMNGMYCNNTGLGGITPIEVSKTFSKTLLELSLTGSQGDVMKESMHCARTVAWNLLTDDERMRIQTKSFGLHIHCPACGMPKDGPSAGGAITLSILSCLKGLPIDNKIAMTGEIDLNGNITAIGGLSEKLLGVKKAGVTRVFFPRENLKDIRLIEQDFPGIFDSGFTYLAVDHIEQVMAEIWPSVARLCLS